MALSISTGHQDHLEDRQQEKHTTRDRDALRVNENAGSSTSRGLITIGKDLVVLKSYKDRVLKLLEDSDHPYYHKIKSELSDAGQAAAAAAAAAADGGEGDNLFLLEVEAEVVQDVTEEYSSWVSIPWWNGEACAVAVMNGPLGECERRKLTSVALTCSSDEDPVLRKYLRFYASEDCRCRYCVGWGRGPWGSNRQRAGFLHFGSFCHTNWLNRCRCALIDEKLKTEEACRNQVY